MLEEWRPVVNYENRYEVSNLGRVRRSAIGKGTKPGRIFHGYVMKIGYRHVALTSGSPAVSRPFYVHFLVASAFLGPRPVAHEINHIDGNKLNNAANNLEYVTKAEQARHAVRIGLAPVGEKRYNAKLTYVDVEFIRSSGLSNAALAKQFSISRSHVWQIKHYQLWTYPQSA